MSSGIPFKCFGLTVICARERYSNDEVEGVDFLRAHVLAFYISPTSTYMTSRYNTPVRLHTRALEVMIKSVVGVTIFDIESKFSPPAATR